MRTILFFTDAHVGAHASEFAGACERALALGWRVVEIEYARTRRHAEQRFHAAVGHSIGEEIFQIRFSKVLQLLPDTRIPIAQIAAECGWDSDSFLKRIFKKHMGQTMRNWRRSLRKT